ncbi:asparagine synthase (glutamine-hydrolyzing) [Nocardia transvalensis]|uniref:asparagine synthase (glutamine-hydrolyzing) n=1 Tax=Nocardia transvalensis TaxID=37333 RepID=UPI001894B596|nr:asparagine synthase (glutamine-hydrolyzing) [Nocardia transvalensis]MBF6332655.1 asparagine synthase (glutamine-hydrolyzing) [Nocardia transvalensis]
MCGVVGFIGSGLRKDRRLDLVRRGIRAIAHRGPDEVGIFDSDAFTLGTVRLSVIDPRLGKQPMVTPDNRYVAGFNGEVFNYIELRSELESKGIRFQTNSDTEVLLHSLAYWGTDALLRLNGQFGFAFYDRWEGKLILGRDRFGERPMLYTERDGTYFFASEIKGLFAFPQVPRELAPEKVRRAMRYWSPVPGETCFAGIEAIPPGHILTVHNGRAELSKYYHGIARQSAAPAPSSFEEAKAGLREVLRESIRLRLRADYPLCTYISGGIDSAVIASIMNDLVDEPLTTFSIDVEGGPVDESPYQRAMVSRLGSRHTRVPVSAAQVRERFPHVVRQCEQPLHFTAPVAYGILAEQVGLSGVRIMLGGEGADELFAGYDAAKEAAIVERCLARGSFAGAVEELEPALNDMRYSDGMTAAAIVRFYADRPNLDFSLGAHLRRFESEPVDELIDAAGGIDDDHAVMLRRLRTDFPDFDRRPAIDRSMLLDMQTFLIGYGMTCLGDRAGTGFGVEGRYPFMDPGVVEYAAALPIEWKLNGTREKHILREAYADVLPPEIVDRPKFGMRVPGVQALLPDGDDWVAAVLSPFTVRRAGFLVPEGVNRLVERVTKQPRGPHEFGHAYVHLLSVLLMEEFLVHDFRVPDVDIDRIMLRNIDGDRDPANAAAS